MVEPKEKRKTSKSETLTIRLDPKTRFMLEFMSRLRGQTITTVVERAIVEAANRAQIDRGGDAIPDDWRDFWSISEGERALRMAREPQLFPQYDEERRLAFSREHWPFFYRDITKNLFITHYVDVLWPKIDEFMEVFDTQKTQDYFSAGRAMQEALRNAKLKAPEWPIPQSERKRPDPRTDVDDEIPF